MEESPNRYDSRVIETLIDKAKEPLIMGILNVTPDSFSDGGHHNSLDRAFDAAQDMIAQGADWIDVGGESTRPGAEPISTEIELQRVLPVIRSVSGLEAKVSVDTSKAKVAELSLASGASMVNDVTAFSDPAMAEICANAGCEVCLMHMKGNPQTMQVNPTYGDVVEEVLEFLLGRAEYAMGCGIPRSKIILDPGIGFGKTSAHNLSLIKNIDRFVATGFPILLGVSRKGFIGRVLGSEAFPVSVAERHEGTLAIHTFTQVKGVSIFRTHDVREAVKSKRMVAELLNA